MAYREFGQSIYIEASPSVVLAHLASFEHHDSIHPMIVAVRELDPLYTADGTTQRRYAITDRMRLGPLTLRFTYLATIYEDAGGELVSDAYQRPRVHLRNTTRCAASGAGTLVYERVTVEAPRPLVGFVLRQAQTAHRAMLASLKALLESPVSTAQQV
jgi:Polyketide cyclase / dehydrase and lipid transport